MEGRRPGRSRDQHGDGRETSSLEAAEGCHQDRQLMRAVRRENTRGHRVCTDAYNRFLERHVQDMEKDLRQRDQRGLYQRCKFLNIEDTRKVNSQYIVMKRA